MDHTRSHFTQDILHQALLQSSATPLLLLDANGGLIDLNPPAQAVFHTQLSQPDACDVSSWFGEQGWSGVVRAVGNQSGWVPAQLAIQLEGAPLQVELQAIPYGQTRLFLMRADQNSVSPSPVPPNPVPPNPVPPNPVPPNPVPLGTNAPQVSTPPQGTSAESDDFAYTVAHDLKEPLRGISNYAGFLLEDYESLLDSSGQDMLNSLVRLAQRSEQLITHLLRFSRLGQQELQLQALHLDPPVTAVLEALRPRLDARNVSCTVQQPLPKAYGDAELVTEVFESLVSNALKYNDKPDPWIRIGGDTWHGQTRFWVQDNGIGINPMYFDKVFKIFKRLHPQDQYEGGSGCGLAIVKKIVERHGGSVWLESQEEVGTTVYFTLPAPPEDAKP